MRGLRKGEYKEYNNAYIPYMPISPKPETKARAKAEGRTKTKARARTFPHPGASLLTFDAGPNAQNKPGLTD